MNSEILGHIKQLSALPHEKALVFFLDGDKIIGSTEHDGKSSQVSIGIEDIVSKAKEFAAKEVVMLHNHPGGTRYPSRSDIEYAKALETAMPGAMVNSYVVRGSNIGQGASLSEPVYTEYNKDFDPALHHKEFLEMATNILRSSSIPFQPKDIEQMFSKVEDMHTFRETINGVLRPFGKSFDLKADYKKYDSMEKEDTQITKTSLSHKINLTEAIDKKKLGRCYELSGRYVLDHPNYNLVHGTITRKDGYTIDHAWTEKNTQMGQYNMSMVFDPVMDLELPWDAYERLLGAKVKKKYNATQMSKSMLGAKHWGPWGVKEDVVPTPTGTAESSNRDKPTEIAKIKEVMSLFRKSPEGKHSIELGKVRDNCGIVATEFAEFAKKYGVEIFKVMGFFGVDKPTFNKNDFVSTEIEQMREEGFNPDLESDRIKFANKNNIVKELKKVPHVWNRSIYGIIDFSGRHQFVETGMSPDLDISRYIPSKIYRA